MSTTRKVEAGSMLAVAAFVLILVAVGFFRISGPDRANDAWSGRLTKQAAHLQEEARAANAWSQRLSGLTAIDFPGLGEFERGAVGMSNRAMDAWADRLTGIAEYYVAQK